MKTKAFVNGLFALALLTPLGVQANGGNDTGGVLASVGTEESCLATFSVSDQTLTLPCVEVVMGTETVLYSAQLQQVEEGRFALTQVAELSAAVESECVASYSLETGALGVPCVEEVNPPEVAETQALVLYAEEPASPSVFVVGEPEGRQGLRAAATCDAQATDKRWRNYCTKNNPFYPTYGGQCTSYAWGRAYERTGTSIQFTVNSGRHAKYWPSLVKNLPFGKQVQADSVAIWVGDSHNPNGHVAYVERVVNGIVYFTEANVKTYSSKNGNYGGGYDGYEKSLTISRFESRGRGIGKIIGYLYLSAPLRLDSEITVTPLVQGQPATITAKISNREGVEDFRGNLYAAFHPLGDQNVSLVDIVLENQPLEKGKDYTYTFGTAVLNLTPGTYHLYIKGDDARALSVTDTAIKNPIIVKVVSAGKATKAPTIVATANSSQNNSAAGVTFQWSNNNDPATIEAIYFSLREADGDQGKAGAIICKDFPIVGKDFPIVGKVETLPSSTCGVLKPNQWYKWAVYLTFNHGSVKQGLVGYFKTGDNASTSPTTSALPVVMEISPLEAKVNQPTDFTVKGSNLTTGMGFTIEHCEGMSAETTDSKTRNSATERTFTCIPRLLGKWLVTVKDKPGGQALTVPSTFQSVAVIGAEVVSISPLQAVLNQSTTFTVTGKNLTAGMGFSIQDCDKSSQETPESLAANSATQRQFVCTPRGQIGSKTVTVKNFPDKTRPGLLIPEGYGVVQFITSPVLTVPYLKQQSIPVIGKDACASASTAMVLAYHGKISADTQSMIEAAKTVFAATSNTVVGLLNRDLLRNHLDQEWDFSVVEFSLANNSQEEIYEKIKTEIGNGRPLILGSKSIYSWGHYVVVVGYNGQDYRSGKVIVNDPYNPNKSEHNFVDIVAPHTFWPKDGILVVMPNGQNL